MDSEGYVNFAKKLRRIADRTEDVELSGILMEASITIKELDAKLEASKETILELLTRE